MVLVVGRKTLGAQKFESSHVLVMGTSVVYCQENQSLKHHFLNVLAIDKLYHFPNVLAIDKSCNFINVLAIDKLYHFINVLAIGKLHHFLTHAYDNMITYGVKQENI